MKLALLVTGFLGSGKTTFILRSLVGRHRDKKLGIVVNDFGEIGYDKLLYYRENLRVQGVDGKCMCCDGGGAFLQALYYMQDVDLLIVETSGVSDPYPIMQALESAGWVSHITLCVVSADSWQDFREDSIFKAQLEYADCVVVSRCDLLPAGIPRELVDILGNKPYFLSYEGKVQEDLYLFLHADRRYTGVTKLMSPVQKRFSQLTIRVNEYVCMHTIENFLKRLPPNIVRVKGVLNCTESPIPMGINWTPRHMCWEPVETSVTPFLNFIYYGILPKMPSIPTCLEFDPWKAVPVGDFDRREGIAYVEGKATDEISAIEYMLQQNIEDFVLVTLPKNSALKFRPKEEIHFIPSPQNVLKDVNTLISHYRKMIFWLIPDAYASFIISKARDNIIIHIGRDYLLPKAFISIRANTQEKIKTIETLLTQGLSVKSYYV